jgi:signal transduction histidine kinase
VASPPDDSARALDLAGPIAEEIARLELLRRLSMGAAHTLNNAFTAILGETLCLLDERKHDPQVAEACSLIQAEVERSAKLTRSVAMRVQRRASAIEESDVGALLRSVEPVLRETVSRSVAIRCESPAPGLCVHGGSEPLEMLALLTAHRLVRASTGGGELAVSIEHAGPGVDLLFRFAVDPTSTQTDPAENADWTALVAAAERALAASCRAAVLDEGPHVKRLRLARADG